MDSIASPPVLPSSMVGDAERFDAAAAQISIPREEPGDSFVLHAPLELLARNALLTLAEPAARDAVFDRMATIASAYSSWGTAVDRTPRHDDALVADPGRSLVDAIAAGDGDTADDAITWLTTHLDTGEFVRALADPVLPSLAAAGHGSILLYLLPRCAPRSLDAAWMARTTVHELVRQPEWRLTWFDERPLGNRSDADDELRRRLVAPVLTERPQNTFIHPTMSTTERTGLATEMLADVIGALPVAVARRVLLRAAALSMLQDDPNHAPYGWSHCLTMPQAALGVADVVASPTRAVAVASTYVLGFRAALGSTELDWAWSPAPVAADVAELVDLSPADAAAAAWHTPPPDRPAVWRTLATHAGPHPDAHLAKYTLACLDAARADPEAHHLFLAGAAYLNAWWRARS